jgi:transposase
MKCAVGPAGISISRSPERCRLVCHPRTLQHWRNASRMRGIDGLRLPWAPGRASRMPETMAAVMVAWVTHGPAGCGLDHAYWTAAALATSLYQTQEIAVSERTMRAFCPTHDGHPSRPPSQYLTGDPAQQAAARPELETCKKSQSRRTRLVASRCGALCYATDAPNHAGRHRALPLGGPSGWSRRA